MIETELRLGEILSYDSIAQLPPNQRSYMIERMCELMGAPRQDIGLLLRSYMNDAVKQNFDACTKLWLLCTQHAFINLRLGQDKFCEFVMGWYWTLPMPPFIEYHRREPVFLETKKCAIDIVKHGMTFTPIPANKERFHWLIAACGCCRKNLFPVLSPENCTYTWLPGVLALPYGWIHSPKEEDYILSLLDKKLKHSFLAPHEFVSWLDEPVVNYSSRIGDLFAHQWVFQHHATGLRSLLKNNRQVPN
ncbi:MAG: hypothetical protein G01um101448_1128 [Parcubacteria group bacterium Gr01-1014_48]|nr:MAG: hypothetical protein G01um101448_1128 [Parcubacteria group bacterium Gr01-1014_48]